MAGELAVPLGLGAALCWGLGDYLAKGLLGRAGLYRTIVLVNAIGFLAALPLVLLLPSLVPGSSDLPPGALPLLLGIGLLSLASQGAFYYAFRGGRLSVVSPVTSVYPAVTILLALLLLGERPGPLRLGGAALALLGIVLLSLRPPGEASGGKGNALLPALAAMVAIGGNLFLVKAAAAAAVGPTVPLLFIRGFGALGYLPLALAGEGGATRGSPGLVAALPVGVVDTLAFFFYNLGVAVGLVAVVSPLAAMYSLVTVLLAAARLGERISPPQLAALVPLLLGALLLALPGG